MVRTGQVFLLPPPKVLLDPGFVFPWYAVPHNPSMSSLTAPGDRIP